MNKFTLGAIALAFVLGGCQNTPTPTSALDEQPAEITLRPGDVISVNFPGAPNLNIQQQAIRRDGKITVGIVGEVAAAGLTPSELQNVLLSKLGDQLLTKEVLVSVVASDFSVYVDGPVLRPGKVVSNHPLTVMEAVMEAGGFDYSKADTRNVTILRHKGQSKDYSYFTLNLKDVLNGTQKDLFYLQPGDIVHVPQKFSWF